MLYCTKFKNTFFMLSLNSWNKSLGTQINFHFFSILNALRLHNYQGVPLTAPLTAASVKPLNTLTENLPTASKIFLFFSRSSSVTGLDFNRVSCAEEENNLEASKCNDHQISIRMLKRKIYQIIGRCHLRNFLLYQ